MTPAEIIEAIIAAAVQYGPGAVDLVKQIVAYVQEKHPELGAPPPVDGVAAIDAEIDAQIAKDEP